MISQHMATAHPSTTPVTEQPRKPAPPVANPTSSVQSLVPVPRPLEEHDFLQLSPPMARLPIELDVSVPVKDFRVRGLLGLEPGQLIESQWVQGDDVPLASGKVQLAWSEFEVVDTQLAVRITRLP